MVIFILLMVSNLKRVLVQARQVDDQKSTIQTLVSGNRKKRAEICSTLNAKGIKAAPDPHDPLLFEISIPETDLKFDHNESTIKAEGKAFLSKKVPEIVSALCDVKYDNSVSSIIIEGHTDSDGDDEHNLRLSQDRSYSVLLFVLNHCGLSGVKRDRFLNLVSANGRGETDLVKTKSSLEDKALSRRVAIKVRLKSYEELQDPELEKILKGS